MVFSTRGKWKASFSHWALCSMLCMLQSLLPTVNTRCRLPYFMSPFTGEWDIRVKRCLTLCNILCACACWDMRMWACRHHSVGPPSLPTLFETGSIVLCSCLPDWPVSSQGFPCFCLPSCCGVLGVSIGLLLSNQNSDAHTHAASSFIQTPALAQC